MTIEEAKLELESCLLTMKEHYKVNWTDKGFKALHFLIVLAQRGSRKAAGRDN